MSQNRFERERERQKEARQRLHWRGVADFVGAMVVAYVRAVPRASKRQVRAFGAFLATWFFGPHNVTATALP